MKIQGHKVIIDEKAKRIVIFRIYDTGQEELYTEISFDDAKKLGEDGFLRMFSENILFDSSQGRRLLGLEF